MKLTKHEIEIAERCIAKRERQLAHWPYRRWVMLVFFSALAILGHRTLMDGVGSINEDKYTDRQVSNVIGDGPPPGLEQRWVVGTMLKINKVLEARHQLVAYGLMQVGLGYMELM